MRAKKVQCPICGRAFRGDEGVRAGDHDDFFEDDEPEDEFECGAWFNGKFDFCQLAGTEDCDWECPYSADVRGLKK